MFCMTRKIEYATNWEISQKSLKMLPNVSRRFARFSIKPLLLAGVCDKVYLVNNFGKYSTKNQKNIKMPSVNGKLVLKYTKVVPEAYPPTKGSVKAAGYDLKSAFATTVPARGKALVDTGLKIQLPEGCYGRIAPRSGLAVKNFIDVGAGVVDEDYRGVLKVVLFNHSDTDFEVNSGDRIAQLICEKIYYPNLEEVAELTDTDRGEGGFGSTGTN